MSFVRVVGVFFVPLLAAQEVNTLENRRPPVSSVDGAPAMMLTDGPVETVRSVDGRSIAGTVLEITATSLVFQRLDRKVVRIPWDTIEVTDRVKMMTRLVVKEDFDKFDGVTKICLKEPIKLPDGVELDARVLLVGEDVKSPIITLGWTRIADRWEWLDHHPVTLLVDGERWGYAGDITSDVFSTGRVYEHVTIRLTAKRFDQLRLAKTVDVRVGIREYKLTDFQRLLLGAVFSAWRVKVP